MTLDRFLMKLFRCERLLLFAAISAGIALRLAEYLRNRSLWGDEVAIATNLRLRGFGGLLHLLSYNQTMPIGLLFVLKTFVSTLGHSELVLRLPALLAGCALIVLTWKLMGKVEEMPIVIVVVALMATSSLLIYYSAEVKQYGVDAVVTLVILYLGIVTLKGEGPQAWRDLIVTGAIAMFFSQPIIFILAGISIAALVDPRFRSASMWRFWWYIAAASWLIPFALLYWLSYRETSQSRFMRAFWAPHFIQIGAPNVFRDLIASLQIVLGKDHLEYVPTLVLFCLFVIGLYGIASRHGLSIGMMGGAPLLLLLLAAAVKQYPLAPRLVLFYIPLLFWIYAASAFTIGSWLPHKLLLPVFALLSVALVLPAALRAGHRARHAAQHEATRDMVQIMKAHNQDTPVYLAFGRYLEWEYYAGDWSHPEELHRRMDTAYQCMTSEELVHLGYTSQVPGDCNGLNFAATSGRPAELVGDVPPAPRSGKEAEGQWALAESNRITAVGSKDVWLFTPVYSDHWFAGSLKSRRLLEKLDSDLELKHCQFVESDARGTSLAYRYACARP